MNGNDEEKLFFISGAAGTGKTFLYNQIIAYARNILKLKIKCSATTGAAACLIEDGVTMHSLFGLPFNINETTKISIDHSSPLIKKLYNTDIFIIDEASAINKNQLHFIDHKLRMVMENSEKFGGKRIILGGDFRQCLPIS